MNPGKFGLILALVFVLSGCAASTSNDNSLVAPGHVLSYIEDSQNLFKAIDKMYFVLSQLGMESESIESDMLMLSYYHANAHLTGFEMGDLEWADVNEVESWRLLNELRVMLEGQDIPIPGFEEMKGEGI